MKPVSTNGMETRAGVRSDDRRTGCGLDEQFGELIETIWACERQWAIDDHIDAVIKYGRQ